MRSTRVGLLQLLTALLFAAAPAGAAAQSCFLVADNPSTGGTDSGLVIGGPLLKIDIQTGQETVIGPTGADNIEAVAYDPFRKRLYAVDGGQFGAIDEKTGVFTSAPDALGTGTGSKGEIAFTDVDGLTVNPLTGTIYGSVRRDDYDDLLIIIDPNSGRAVRNAFGDGKDYVVIQSSDNLIDIDDLAFDADRNVLYGIANDAGKRDGLVRIDPATGRTSLVGPILRRSGSAVENVKGLAFSFDGSLLGVLGGSATKIYRIDPQTAGGERVFHLAAASDYEAIECYVPSGSNRIEGRVFNDANLSEFFEDGEGGVFGAPVHLYRDVNGNDSIDAHDTLLLSTETDGDGNYDFRFYAGGRFLVTVDIGFLPDEARITTRSVRTAFFDGFDQHVREADFGIGHLPSVFEVSGGGDAGIESEGSMAVLLAQRLFTRRQDAHLKAALKSAPQPVPYAEYAHALFAEDAPLSKSGFADVAQIIPAEGPLNSLAFVVTPGDLLGATNAFSLFAADYLRPEGKRVAAVFAATTPLGRTYDHSKTICDRLSGSRLEDVRLIEAAGASFVLTRTAHADGRIDHASSFIAYKSDDRYIIDSRFDPSTYAFVAPSSEVLNLQVWSLSPDMTAALIEKIIRRLEMDAPVEFRNAGSTAPGVPEIFVRAGTYRQGRLHLNLVNHSGAQRVTLKGSIARSEIAAGRAQRVAYERTFSLASGTSIEVPLGAIYDVELAVEYEGGESFDRIYHADGAWSYQRGSLSSISYFETFAEPQGPPSPDRFVVERGAYVSGSLSDWAAMFRYLQAGGRSVDLSPYGFLEFRANGRGIVRVVLEKEGVDTWDQYGYTIELEPAQKVYRIPFDAFTRIDGTGGFTADDVTLIAFYVQPTNQPGARFDLGVDNVTFGGTTTVGVEDENSLPRTVVLDGNYPNPFNPSTRIRFTLSTAQHVRLAVYDLLGRPVATPFDGPLAAGVHDVTLNAASLASGTYVYRLESAGDVVSRTMILAK